MWWIILGIVAFLTVVLFPLYGPLLVMDDDYPGDER